MGRGWISDYANIRRIHPLISRSYVEGGASCGVGALRVCEMKGGMYLKERVVDWREGSQYTVDVYDRRTGWRFSSSPWSSPRPSSSRSSRS